MKLPEAAHMCINDTMCPPCHWACHPVNVMHARPKLTTARCPADYLHPGGLGQKVMSDLAVMLIQDTVIELLMYPWSQQDQAMLNEPIPPPMYPGQSSAPHGPSNGSSLKVLEAADVLQPGEPGGKGSRWLAVPGGPTSGSQAASARHAACMEQ